jgi:hypothetical protein
VSLESVDCLVVGAVSESALSASRLLGLWRGLGARPLSSKAKTASVLELNSAVIHAAGRRRRRQDDVGAGDGG